MSSERSGAGALAPRALLFLLLVGLLGVPSEAAQPLSITVYSGRTRELVAPLLEQFTRAAGITVRARYGETAELAATILEEGPNSPADLFFAQDAGALGAISYADRLRPLPEETLRKVEARFRSADGAWVGVSGRARVVAYNTRRVPASALPRALADVADPRWRGRIGWAPVNGSFQAHVTALRLIWGTERTRRWLVAVKNNGTRAYRSNPAIVAAVGAGEIDLGLVNHYYLYRFLQEQGPAFPVRNHFFPSADPGNLINVAGAGVLATTKQAGAALRFVDFLLSPEGQRYFAAETFEYPLAGGVAPHPTLPRLAQIHAVGIDLNHLQALEETLRLLRETGIL